MCADQPSKAASVHLTRTMANSLAEKFILVNAICPGVFPSRMTAYGLAENKDILEGVQPTGRIGSPQDIGGMALFLSGRAGGHVTGQAVSFLCRTFVRTPSAELSLSSCSDCRRRWPDAPVHASPVDSSTSDAFPPIPLGTDGLRLH